MSKVAAADDSKPVKSNSQIISELEEQYIKILESKITQLKSQPSTGNETKTDHSQKDNAFSEAADDVKSNSGNHTASVKEEDLSEQRSGTDSGSNEEPRYVTIISKWDSEKGEFIDETADTKDEKKDFGPQPKPRRAFTFRKVTSMRSRNVRDKSPFLGSEVDIEFEPLQRLVGQITTKWGWSETVIKCRSPYSPLIYSWREALDESQKIVEDESEDMKQARIDFGELLKMISTSSGHAFLDQYFKERDTFLKENTIKRNALWTLFPPGTLILARPFLDEPQIFSVESCDSFVSDGDSFQLDCYSFDWNGSEFTRVKFKLSIDRWSDDDRRSIVELPFYPLKFYKEAGMTQEESLSKLKKELIERGKTYETLCKAKRGEQMFKYEGIACFQRGGTILLDKSSSGENTDETSSKSGSSKTKKSSGNGGIGKKQGQISGVVMVDFASFLEYQSPEMPLLGSLQRSEDPMVSLSPEKRANSVFKEMYKFDWDGLKPHRPMTDDQYLLCPPRVLGYALKQKAWVQLLVSKVQQPDAADRSTFEQKLQLHSQFKELIRKSVMAHAEGKKEVDGHFRVLDDFAPAKGKGLVILLYGLPGVGKTLTAESVAQMAGKPLFSVGVSDIGIEGEKVETNLQKVFDLAGIWEAVLLFDEADVFLESRGEGQNDITRNAMVSGVLLRVLEYYDGILILTTNRMRSFDIAVQSRVTRVHLAIKYDELMEDQKRAIFNSFLSQLKKKHLIEDFDDVSNWAAEEGTRYKLNGRQIRNIVSTALGIALAEGEHQKLTWSHLASILRMTDEFQRGLADQDAIYRDKQFRSRF